MSDAPLGVRLLNAYADYDGLTEEEGHTSGLSADQLKALQKVLSKEVVTTFDFQALERAGFKQEILSDLFGADRKLPFQKRAEFFGDYIKANKDQFKITEGQRHPKFNDLKDKLESLPENVLEPVVVSLISIALEGYDQAGLVLLGIASGHRLPKALLTRVPDLVRCCTLEPETAKDSSVVAELANVRPEQFTEQTIDAIVEIGKKFEDKTAPVWALYYLAKNRNVSSEIHDHIKTVLAVWANTDEDSPRKKTANACLNGLPH